MDRETPILAPEPRRGMVITGGWCPEFWRWRVAGISARGITLVDRHGRVQIQADQWLPWLAGRCELDPTYVDGQRIRCPAAVPLVLPGDVAEPFPQRPEVGPADLATRLREAREVLAHYRLTVETSKDSWKTWHLHGVRGQFVVVFNPAASAMPRCTCASPGTVCKHGLAVLLHDPAGKVLLLRILT